MVNICALKVSSGPIVLVGVTLPFAQIRVWNIPDRYGKVVDYADVHEIVTAAVFSADGSQVMIGTMKGKCQFLTCDPETFKLQYKAQIGTFHAISITFCHICPLKPTAACMQYFHPINFVAAVLQ